MSGRILIVDDEPNILTSFSSLMSDEGHASVTAGSAEDARRHLTQSAFDLILLDIQLPGESGLDLLRHIRENNIQSEVLVISGQADIPMALEAVKLGAVDFLEKPVQPEKLLASVGAALQLSRANRQRALATDELDRQSPMIGESSAMQTLKKTIAQVAPTDTTVLITGANGTGKELVATRLYLGGKRRDHPFVKVNCPGIPETLFESELFGHMKGSFTGAVRDHPGKFAMADGGTIFLDEIGDLPQTCQAKLLRVLESGEIETLGSDQRHQVDVRMICATNRDLPKLVSEGKFREDLYYRISVFVIDTPPLSSRREDIPILIGEFLRRYCPGGKTTISSEGIAFLSTQAYPGNVRQLKNLIERLCILHPDHTVSAADLQTKVASAAEADPSYPDGNGLAEKMLQFERTLIARTLKECGNNISEAARVLGVNRANLSKKVKDLGLK